MIKEKNSCYTYFAIKGDLLRYIAYKKFFYRQRQHKIELRKALIKLNII